MPCPLAEAIEVQRIWTSKAQYADAERKFHSKVSSSEAIFLPINPKKKKQCPP